MASFLHTTDDGCRLAASRYGDPAHPALVLINSLGTDRSLWDAQAGPLAQDFHVLAFDARGHGASDAPPGDYTIARLGRDVLSLMDGAGIARAHVAGVSIGGLTALWLGSQAPHRVDRLVLANTAAKVGTPEFWAERIRLVDTGGLEALAELTMPRWFTPTFRRDHPDVVGAMRAAMIRGSATGYRGCCAALRDADLRPETSRVAARTLVVTGAHDVATPPALGEALCAGIAGARLLSLPAAHLANVECAEAFTAAVRTFLLEP